VSSAKAPGRSARLTMVAVKGLLRIMEKFCDLVLAGLQSLVFHSKSSSPVEEGWRYWNGVWVYVIPFPGLKYPPKVRA